MPDRQAASYAGGGAVKHEKQQKVEEGRGEAAVPKIRPYVLREVTFSQKKACM